ncbi:MAG: hypothetical protein H5U07_10235 [Candidatus Aminicenantes bacterium]|nr:hypothetical protein [Candidatus Aminicenantes bacterium]
MLEAYEPEFGYGFKLAAKESIERFPKVAEFIARENLWHIINHTDEIRIKDD